MDLLKKYMDARENLAEYFDAPIWYNLCIHIDDKWSDYGSEHSSVGWEYQESADGEGDFMYGMEVYGTSRWESKDGKYTLFVGDDGCGNRDCYIFANENKIEV